NCSKPLGNGAKGQSAAHEFAAEQFRERPVMPLIALTRTGQRFVAKDRPTVRVPARPNVLPCR
ncbi:hypothetical protein, partial [Nocardia sp. NPDC005825]|uniref:hypothetical protein n=1 Tax=unclassified Nocardia TaxID=2637762 RepID=UPI0033E0531C